MGAANLSTGKLADSAIAEPTRLFVTSISPDGKHLAGFLTAATSPKKQVEVWSLETGKRLHVLTLGDSAPSVVTFVPGGKLAVLILGGVQRSIQVYDLATGGKIHDIAITAEAATPGAVGFSGGGRYVAMGERGGRRISVYDLTTGQLAGEVITPGSQQRRVKGIAFSHDGNELAVVGEVTETHLAVFSVTTSKLIYEPQRCAYSESMPRPGAAMLEYLPGDAALRYGSYVIARANNRVIYQAPRGQSGSFAAPSLLAVGPGTLLKIPASPGRPAELRVGTAEFKPPGPAGAPPAARTTVAAADKAPEPMAKDEPAKQAAAEGSGPKSDPASPGRGEQPPSTPVDRTKIQVIHPLAAPASWAYAPPAGSLPKPSPVTSIIEYPSVEGTTEAAEADRPEREHAVAFSGSPGNAVALSAWSVPSGTRVKVHDLGGARSLGVFAFSWKRVDLMDLGADGRSLLVRTGDSRLDLYQLERKAGSAELAPRHVAGWVYDVDNTSLMDSNKVTNAWILDARHVLARTESGQVALFRIEAPVVAVYKIAGEKLIVPALSFDRKTLALGQGEKYFLVEAMTGKMLGTLPRRDKKTTSLAFHPDGSRLAASRTEFPMIMDVWDLRTGRTYAQLDPRRGYGHGTPRWVSERYVLMGKALIDVPMGDCVWVYEHQDEHALLNTPDTRLWGFWSAGLFPFEVPDAAVVKVLDEKGTPKKPGVTVLLGKEVVGGRDAEW